MLINLIKHLWLSIFYYYTIQFAYYWYHKLLHNPKSGILYRLHFTNHHKKDFPLRRLRAKTYSSNGTGGWFQTGGELVFGLPVITMLCLFYILLPLAYFINLFSVLSFVAFSGESSHSSYHLTSYALNHPEGLVIHNFYLRQKWFSKYRMLHDIHHATPNFNYGFLDMTMVKLFGTYSEYVPKHLQRYY